MFFRLGRSSVTRSFSTCKQTLSSPDLFACMFVLAHLDCHTVFEEEDYHPLLRCAARYSSCLAILASMPTDTYLPLHGRPTSAAARCRLTSIYRSFPPNDRRQCHAPAFYKRSTVTIHTTPWHVSASAVLPVYTLSRRYNDKHTPASRNVDLILTVL